MPTLEEELEALKRELSLLQSRHTSDIKRLGERIDTLQQQIDEQKKRTSEQEQSTLKKFDTLTGALVQQFNAISAHMNTRFDTQDANLYQHFTSINARFSTLEQRIDRQTADLRQKFDSIDHFAARTWGLAQEQERDIREMKTDVGIIKEQVAEVRQDMNGRFERVDQRFESVATQEQLAEVRQDMNSRFDAQGQILQQILERLPR